MSTTRGEAERTSAEKSPNGAATTEVGTETTTDFEAQYDRAVVEMESLPVLTEEQLSSLCLKHKELLDDRERYHVRRARQETWYSMVGLVCIGAVFSALVRLTTRWRRKYPWRSQVPMTTTRWLFIDDGVKSELLRCTTRWRIDGFYLLDSYGYMW